MQLKTTLVLSFATVNLWSAPSGDHEMFETKIRPLLAAQCYTCHTNSRLGGLRVDSRAALLEGGKSGPAMVPGAPESSLLMKAVTHADPRIKMPVGTAKLSDSQIADLSDWIKRGAPWPNEKPVQKAEATGFRITAEQRAFWSLQPIRKPALPAVRDAAWAQSPIDRFLLARLEQKGLKPVAAADKRTLLRRATFDLTGLPPTPEQMEAFLADSSPDAFRKVVDRLLESPHYGERWARHWLDVARYADGERQRKPNGFVFIGYGMDRDGYANTWRYRDWVIRALNRDMPYDQFVRMQIAGDLISEKRDEDALGGLGFFGLGPWFTGDDVIFTEARANERDDKVDTLSRGLLGMTVSCARCHDHKYDPISQKDYYALAGVFANAGFHEYNLVPETEARRFEEHRQKIKAKDAELQDLVSEATLDVAENLAKSTARYMMAARQAILSKSKPAPEEGLDTDTTARWVKYLQLNDKQHPFLKEWDSMMAQGGGKEQRAREIAGDFQNLVLSIIPEKREIDRANDKLRKNYKPDPNEKQAVLPGGLMQFELFQFKQSLVQKVIEPKKFYVWLDIVQSEQGSVDYAKRASVYEYREAEVLKRLSADQKAKIDAVRQELEALRKSSPPEYPYIMGLADAAKPENLKLNVRGNPHVLGDEVSRGFPAVLAGTERDPKPFSQGSGRLELADAILKSPLAARVMVNRIWLQHFGRGIVDTPSNFGMLGERPSHPELLDYLAARLVENKWSLKAIHREMMLSAAYQMSTRHSEAAAAADPDNRLLWRANLRRLDVESLRDSLLFVAGALDERVGGPPQEWSKNNKKRTVYGRVSRNNPDGVLSLFDFPDPTITNEQRSVTNVPLQGLFFLNSELVTTQAQLLAKRLGFDGSEADAQRIREAYRVLYGRPATDREVNRGLAYLKAEGAQAAPQYTQALLSANEFFYLN